MDQHVILKTKRLLLRRFNMDDVDDVFGYINLGQSDTDTSSQPADYSRKYIETLVEMFSDSSYWVNGHPGLPIDSNGAGLLQLLAVIFEGKVIGEIALNQRIIDVSHERVEMAYNLSPRHWNKGLMTEAARAVMDWTFRTHDIKRMYAWCDEKNIGSRRVLEKLGMKREGRLRSHIKTESGFHDQLYFGILREEWENL